ncbi:MAG: sugar phosphate isomerase/epimerase [Clostridia bacterium]|nr:sugar phosphate isomerase/epimerase [Clostridia bacterium]
MAFGISTSCLYPLETEKSLDTLGKIGVKTCEVFLNSPSETTLKFAKTLNKIRKEYGIKIASVHPFSSFAETYMLFSAYGRRFNDMLEFYKCNFEVTAALGAEFSVIHGALTGAKISDTEYFERFAKLIEEGKKSGIKVCHENVNRHLCESPVFIEKMKNYLGDGFKLVFDVKQAVRAGYSPLDFAEKFKNDIVHIHISDHTGNSDCLPPGKGCFEFKKLIEIMNSANYDGDYIIELYRENFGNESDLKNSLVYMQNL